MKRIATLLLICSLLLCCIPVYAEENANKEDPFLSVFPDFDWSMTKDDLLTKYSTNQFEDKGIALVSKQNVNDDTVTYTFMLTGKKIAQIMILIENDKEEYYYNQFRELYGNPIISSFGTAMIGMPVESTDGDTYVWKTNGTYTCLHDDSVFYMPIY